MAVAHGTDDYLRNQKEKHKDIGITAVLAMFASLVPYWYLVILTGFSLLPFIVITLVYLLIMFLIYRIYKAHLISASSYRKAIVSEQKASDELEGLPASFRVIKNLMLPTGKGNIDLVVIGPTGVWTVEVKSHSGEISYDTDQHALLHNGSTFEKDILKQAYAQAMSVRRFIGDTTGISHIAHPVIVFTSPFVTVRFGLHPVQGVYVIGMPYLIHLLKMKGKDNLSENEQKMVFDALSTV